MSHGLQCVVCVAECWFGNDFVNGVGHCCASMRSNFLTVCLLNLVLFIGVQFWSQHWLPDDIPCCGSGRNAKHSALTSREHSLSSDAPSSIPPSYTTKRKPGFCSMVSGSAVPCFLTRKNLKKKKLVFEDKTLVFQGFGKAAPVVSGAGIGETNPRENTWPSNGQGKRFELNHSRATLPCS